MSTPRVKPEELRFMPQGNRSINPRIVQTLIESIREYGLTRDVVAIRTSVFGDGYHWYIVDGQHLFMACQAEKILKQLSIKFVPKKFTNIKDIVKFVAKLNTTQSPWKLSDYVYAYASTHEFRHYNTLIAKKKKTGLPFNLCGIIYGEEGKKAASTNIKSGDFWVKNEKRSDEIATIIIDLVDIFGRSNSTGLTKFSYILTKWYRSLDFDQYKFKKYIEKHLDAIMVGDETQIYGLLNKFEIKGEN